MPDELTIIVPDPALIEIPAFQGAKGAKGATGDPGAGGAAYVHTQGSASVIWTIAHNLGVRPTIELLDTGGAEIDAEVIHLSTITAQAFFTHAIAGTARCL